ncbi:hypothetical protein Glove_155g91 [Diversispora epigaea]|uniref:Protein kinase domain-containing protein n=1 Tax=Diversispora epigaea TaxID=1348612 RepID=A0A397IV09_9GLOM|nr:hypothetical protein Glove_155g91 [Diversispora epigaea]
MSQGKITYCPAGHSSGQRNYISFDDGTCSLCSREHYIQEFKTWSSGNSNIDNFIQESQINNNYDRLQWIPYDNFQNINHIADGGCKVALKEIKDSRFDIFEFLKVMKTANEYEYGLEYLETSQEKNFVHCDLHSGNILIGNDFDFFNLVLGIDLGLCKLENDLILNANKKKIVYEMVTAQQPFADQAHDTYLMIDICNGVRSKVPDFMLNWIPEWYLDLMYRCWSDDPSERPTAVELVDLFNDALSDTVDNNVMRQLKIADENQKKYIKTSKARII